MKVFTKDSLIAELQSICGRGWIASNRQGNAGGVGNTIEDLLEITENNLPLPNAAEWELKCQRLPTSSLTTLLHMEPSPRALKFVPKVLLPKYGWRHEEAGRKYGASEMSFRQTIHAGGRSDRGFKVVVDRKNEKFEISFDAKAVSPRHKTWLQTVRARVGLGELDPQPYWGFEDLYSKARSKLLNCFYVQSRHKKEGGIEYFQYEKIMMLRQFTVEKFAEALEEGYMYVDFDARTGHNHGTKFRVRKDKIPALYSDVTVIA